MSYAGKLAPQARAGGARHPAGGVLAEPWPKPAPRPPQEIAFTITNAKEYAAAVLGGTQSLHANSRDEAIALPTGKAAWLALRAQQVIAYETDVAKVVDPLADPTRSSR